MINWNDAPEWANYVAMDETGEYYWFERKPECFSSVWLNGGRCQLICSSVPTWRQSLQERPAN